MKNKGFTLIELVMVVVILGILAAVAMPAFFNLQDDAKVAAVRGGLGGLRSGVAIWYAKESAAGTPGWPSLSAMSATTNGVMQGGIVPNNPYTDDNTIVAGTAEAINDSVGWIYDANTGKVWSSATETQGLGY